MTSCSSSLKSKIEFLLNPIQSGKKQQLTMLSERDRLLSGNTEVVALKSDTARAEKEKVDQELNSELGRKARHNHRTVSIVARKHGDSRAAKAESGKENLSCTTDSEE